MEKNLGLHTTCSPIPAKSTGSYQFVEQSKGSLANRRPPKHRITFVILERIKREKCVKKNLAGTQGRTRTGTPVKAGDFESPASTIPPLGPGGVCVYPPHPVVNPLYYDGNMNPTNQSVIPGNATSITTRIKSDPTNGPTPA